MKNIISITLLLWGLCACSSKPPKPPEPIGALSPINPPEIIMEDLKVK